MSDTHDPFSFDAEYGDPDYVKAARDPNRPPEPGRNGSRRSRQRRSDRAGRRAEPVRGPPPKSFRTSMTCCLKTNRIRTATSTPER